MSLRLRSPTLAVTILKKLFFKQKLRSLRRSRREAARKNRSKYNAAKRSVAIYHRGISRTLATRAKAESAPRVLSLEENWNETVAFLSKVRKGISHFIRQQKLRKGAHPKRKNKILEFSSYFDFKRIESISVPVALMLASEYDRLCALTGVQMFAIDMQHWKPGVRSLLSQIGFLELANVDEPKSDVFQDGTYKLLKLRRGQKTEGETIAAEFEKLGIDLVQIEDTRLYDAIMEAITNSVHHAYGVEGFLDEDTLTSWWITAEVSGEGDHRELRVVVYDQGATIPRTIPTWKQYPAFIRLFKKLVNRFGDGSGSPDPHDPTSDGDAIRVALEVGRSSTKSGHRGKGLDQIVSALELCKSGTVSIYSRNGAYRKQRAGAGESINHSQAIVGTLIFWDLVL